ncbi:MAG: heavy metal-binding domain-containing protein [Ignavibacteriales bacterium]|nr:heavy metal-binding domain-containing protein [Ignavibacteriales bacterium]
MKKSILVLIIFSSIICLSGCTGKAVYLKSDKTFKETDPKKVQVYSITNPARSFEVVGYVSTYTSNADRAGDQLRDNLRNQAATYGADAIIGFKLNIGMGGGGGAQGVAVKYTE